MNQTTGGKHKTNGKTAKINPKNILAATQKVQKR